MMLPVPTYIGFGAVLAGFIASRILSERAVRLLSDSEKLALIDRFSRLRALAPIPMVILAGAFVGLSALPSHLIVPGWFTAWALLMIYINWKGIYVRCCMRELGVSPAYLIASGRARWCALTGLFVLFGCLSYVLMERANWHQGVRIGT